MTHRHKYLVIMVHHFPYPLLFDIAYMNVRHQISNDNINIHTLTSNRIWLNQTQMNQEVTSPSLFFISPHFSSITCSIQIKGFQTPLITITRNRQTSSHIPLQKRRIDDTTISTSSIGCLR